MESKDVRENAVWEEYMKKCETAWAECKKICDLAWVEYTNTCREIDVEK